MNFIKFLNQKNSIIRRSLLILLLNIPVGIFGLALNFLSTKITNSFGLFLLSISSINILCSGAIVLNIIITQNCLKEQFFVEEKFKNNLSLTFTTSFLCFAILFIFSVILSFLFDLSFKLLISIFISSILIYIAETGRVFLQCKDNFLFVGYYMIIMFLCRLIFTLSSLYLFEKISISILTFGIASCIPFSFVFFKYIKKINFEFNNNLKKINNLFFEIVLKENEYIFLIFLYTSFGIVNFSDLIFAYLYFLIQIKLNICISNNSERNINIHFSINTCLSSNFIEKQI